MDKEHIQPPELFASERFGFSQVVASPPGKLVFISGQIAWDSERKLVGGSDLAAQAKHALSNLGHALRAAGARPSDVTMLRAYIVNFVPEQARELAPCFLAFLDDAKPPASTWVGVQALAAPGALIEIEAVAVVEA
ncbi:MAG: RidA family protein [Proteobacteria bacterium]|nr:RidA family protein [Pseudomonadota bacterium]